MENHMRNRIDNRVENHVSKAIKFFTNHFRYAVYTIVLICFSQAKAGSYDDFFKALAIDDPRTVSSFLKRGFDANVLAPNGHSGLFFALQKESYAAANALLESSSLEVNVLNETGESPLMMAAMRGHLELSRRLVERGASVNLPGWAPLHYAAVGPEPKVVSMLIAKGAQLDALSPNGSTPLMMAARYGEEVSVDMLLAKGADPGVTNQQGMRAVDFARSAGRDKLADRLAKSMTR